MKLRVLISITTSPGHPYVHKQVLLSAINLERDERVEKTFIIPSKNPYENNLNHIVNEFMSGDHDYWVNIDSDNPPMRNPIDLVFLGKDIIGCPTPVWHCTGKGAKGESPIYWNGYDLSADEEGYKEHKEKQGLQEVDAIGTGCFIAARRVFENLEMRKGPFMRKWKEDGTVDKGNDISFCERAIANHFKIFCHYGYPCMHFNVIDLNQAIMGFSNMFGK